MRVQNCADAGPSVFKLQLLTHPAGDANARELLGKACGGRERLARGPNGGVGGHAGTLRTDERC